jgi:hypothetical protein
MIISPQNSLPFQATPHFLPITSPLPQKKFSQFISNNKLVINSRINMPIFVNHDKFVKIFNPKTTPLQINEHTCNGEDLFNLNM